MSPLKQLQAWVVWRLEQVEDEAKLRKVPYYVNGRKRKAHGSPEDRAQLASYEAAREACVKGNYSGIGFCFREELGVIGVDFDDVVRDGVVDPRVLSVIEGTYAEFSPSGTGVHAFFFGSLPSRKDNEPLPGRYEVEYFCTSGYLTMTDRPLPVVEMFGWDIAPLTPAAKRLYEERFGAIVEPGEAHELMALSPKVGMTIEAAREAVMRLNADCGYDEWWPVGAALHHEFDGSGEAFELFKEWSLTGSKPATERVIASKWESFGRYSGSPRTMLWVLKQSNALKTLETYEARDAWRDMLKATQSEFDLREKVCPQIAKDARLQTEDREALAQQIAAMLKGWDTKLPIAAVRKLIAPKVEHKKTNLPDWLQGMYFVTDRDKFYRYDSEEWYTKQGFDLAFSRYAPRNEDGEIAKMASHFAMHDVQIKKVTRPVFMPTIDAPDFIMNGVECVNTYRPSSVPQETKPDALGEKAIAAFKRHISLVCGDREEVTANLLAWMAYAVQNPGQKIHWMPIIKGVQGDGKSTIGKLMRTVLGLSNTKIVMSKVLASDFNGWAEGALLCIFEELRVAGMSRHEVYEALKPNITNDVVQVHRKGLDAYDAMNVSNQIGFTNHEDNLPLEDTDRRCMIIWTPWKHISELEAKVGDRRAYFDTLHAYLETQPGALRWWLLHHEIPADWHPKGHAPDTPERGLTIALGATEEEDILVTAIEAGGEGVSSEVISSPCLDAALSFTNHRLDVYARNRALNKLGYVKYPKLVKWRGRPHRVYTKNRVAEPAEIRRLLDLTVSAEKS